MRRLPVLVALSCALVALPAPAIAGGPKATTDAATSVTVSQATLLGTITSSGVTTYHFDWGTSTAYGNVMPSSDGSVPSGAAAHQMSQTLTGLAAGTTFHYRIVATNGSGVSRGADETFTTAAVAASSGATGGTPAVTGNAGTIGKTIAAAGPAGAVVSGGAPANGADAAPGDDGSAATSPSGGAAKPARGTTVVGTAATGAVLVRPPGSTAYTALGGSDGAALPVGTVIDATRGTFSMVSALDDAGHTQKATFWGGRFTVRQPAGGDGRVELRLVGTLTGCREGVAKAAAVTKKKRKKMLRLWGQDNHGRFLTQGRYSAATVRGTTWLTTETCAGTRTTVAKGAVSVFDKVRRRTVLVRAGHTYLARRP